MGPHFFKCGNPAIRRLIAVSLQTSMGPHFFKCGNRFGSVRLPCPLCWTSMGPHFFKCGNSEPRQPVGAKPQHFNGAALFQVRKFDLRLRQLPPQTHFNGAALFQVRKF